jgi:hypothetical protein
MTHHDHHRLVRRACLGLLLLSSAVASACNSGGAEPYTPDDTYGGDGGDDGTDPPDDQPFTSRIGPDDCNIDMLSVEFTDSETGMPIDDVPRDWTSCWFDWGGDLAEDEHWITVMLLAPGTSGSIVAPGPRWLYASAYVSQDTSTTLPVELELPHPDDDVSFAQVFYNDTDDPDASAWTEPSGEVTFSAIDGEVTPGSGSDYGGDAASATFTVDFSRVTLELMDGRVVDVEGELTVSGSRGAAGGGDGGGGGGGWGACPSVAGESCVAMDFSSAMDPSTAEDDFKASCALTHDGDVGKYQSGKCPTAGAVADCTGARGTLESTGEKVDIEVVWYPAACGLNLPGTCTSLGGTYGALDGC